MTALVRTAACLGVLLGTTAFAQQAWAPKQMFDKDKVDFGVIATGSDTKKSVTITNIYSQELHISNTRTTCGCSVAKMQKYTLAPGESAVIDVLMDTRKFRRRKDSNLIVEFDRPRVDRVTIPITAYIRTDVVFTPGKVDFNRVAYGQGGRQSIDIAYAGRPDWRIREIRSGSRNLSATATELSREGGNIRYRMDVQLDPKMPAGQVSQLLTLITDDAANPYVPVLVEAVVESDFQISPSVVDFGFVRPGERKTKSIVIRGKKPFRIESIGCASGKDCFEVTPSQRSPQLYTAKLTIEGPSQPGRFSENFVVQIAGREDPIQFRASGNIR